MESNAKASKLKKFAKKYGFIPVLLVLCYLFLVVFQYGIVPTESMYPAIPAGSYLIEVPLAYHFGDIERGDIIIFPHGEKNLVKRVIGLPGEKVRIGNGQVFINDICIDESDYLPEGTPTMTEYGLYPIEYIVPEDSYFVMGDNRTQSTDSRFWFDDHYIERSQVEGVVLVCIPNPFWDGEE